VEECLDYDPTVRPTIVSVCERIQVSKEACMEEFQPKDVTVISLKQQVEQLKLEVHQVKSENDELKQQLVSAKFCCHTH